MANQNSAILRLLDDDDASTVTLVRSQLAEMQSLHDLQQLRALAGGRAARHLDTLILEIASRQADAAFMATCKTFREHDDIEEASWQLAAAFHPGTDFRAQRETLDKWGSEVAARLSGVLNRAERVAVLSEYLGLDVRLRGNDDDYYNIDNSLLPKVIASKLGIPITLSLVYILVGRRAGLNIDGVGLPGHFLARLEDVFFDPFHGGRRVGLDECSTLMEQQNLVLTPQHLLPTTPRQMLIRTLTNIHFIAEKHNPALASRIAKWLDALRVGEAGFA